MKLKSIYGVLAAATLVAFIESSASASIVYVGYSDPSAIPPSSADMLYYLNAMVTAYDNGPATGTINTPGASDGPFEYFVNSTSGNLALSTGVGSNISVGGGPNSESFTFVGGYTGYIVLGWDGTQGADQVYYLSGVTNVTFSNTNLPEQFRKGLSNYWLGDANGTTPVPEPTTVFAGAMLLLPLGIGAFRALRKDRCA